MTAAAAVAAAAAAADDDGDDDDDDRSIAAQKAEVTAISDAFGLTVCRFVFTDHFKSMSATSSPTASLHASRYTLRT